MIALVKFSAVVSGKQVTYKAGDVIPAKVAKELNLEAKPNLATSKKQTDSE